MFVESTEVYLSTLCVIWKICVAYLILFKTVNINWLCVRLVVRVIGLHDLYLRRRHTIDDVIRSCQQTTLTLTLSQCMCVRVRACYHDICPFQRIESYCFEAFVFSYSILPTSQSVIITMSQFYFHHIILFSITLNVF